MMNPERQRRSLIAFFVGSKAASLEKNDPELVIAAGRKAYGDLNRTLHGIRTHPKVSQLREATDRSIQNFIQDLSDVNTASGFDEKHHEWCLQTIKRFEQEPHPERTMPLHYGQAQKWLNMALKYLAVFDHQPLKHVYKFLHIPVDNIIYEQASQLGVPRPSTRWSRLDSEQYREYQHKLRDRIKTTSQEYSAPLDWEADVWIKRAPPEE